MSDDPDDELITGYIRKYTQPIQWVSWWMDAAGTPQAGSLGAALFESDGVHLRDLTIPAVREEVIRVVLGSSPLRQAVSAEVEQLLETVSERLAGGNSSNA